jgi:hypothetical protein
MLLAALGLDHERPAIGMAKRRLERLGDSLLGVGPRAQAVDHHLDGVLRVLGEAGRRVELVHLAVDPHPGESLGTQLLQQVRLLAFAPGHHRRKDHEPRVLRQLEHVVHHLRHGLRLELEVVLRAIRRAGAREKKPQVIVDLGDGADGGARIVARRLLFDRNRGR